MNCVFLKGVYCCMWWFTFWSQHQGMF